MLLFLTVAILSVIGVRSGVVTNNRIRFRLSLIVLLVDIVLFVTGSILYAIYD